MAKTIDTLTTDIARLFGQTAIGTSHTFDIDKLAAFGVNVAQHMQNAVTARTGKRKPNTLYMSEVGTPCMKQLWFKVFHPDCAEPMQPQTLFKFAYGNMLEEAALLLAAEAGHKVEDQQRVVSMPLGSSGYTIRGRIDAKIDGVLVDVKSCSPYGFNKFKAGLTDENDSFGYRYQLSAYTCAMNEYGLEQGFLAVDKQNGHIAYFKDEYIGVSSKLIEVRDMLLGGPAVVPERGFELTTLDNGNKKLCVECSYCPFKGQCWKDANDGHGLRVYLYSNGPVFLGTVHKEPRVTYSAVPIYGSIECNTF